MTLGPGHLLIASIAVRTRDAVAICSKTPPNRRSSRDGARPEAGHRDGTTQCPDVAGRTPPKHGDSGPGGCQAVGVLGEADA